MNMSMTKKDLLELIKDFPDNATVYVAMVTEGEPEEASYVQLEKRIVGGEVRSFINIGA